MRLTNNLNLPLAIFHAVSNDTYTKASADFSVTELLNPPQISYLHSTHEELIEVDVSDEIFKLLGSATHAILEQAGAALTSVLKEVILIEEVEVDGVKLKIKGQIDSFALAEGKLQDFKVTTVWKFKADEALPQDWFWQQNIYAWMLRKRGLDVRSSEIVGILRDWSKMETLRNENYPKHQVAVASVELLGDVEVEAFLASRISEHLAARSGNPRPCTDEERWMRPTKWAVLKDGAMKAAAVFDTEIEARADMARRKGSYSVQHRPGIAVRCQSYCAVNKFCPQFRDLLDVPLQSINVGA